MGAQILIPQPVDREGVEYLLQRGYKLLCPGAWSHADMLRYIPGCNAVLLRAAVVDREILEAGKGLKIVARHGAGFDNVDIEAAAALGIWATNTPLATNCSVAEFTLALILMLAKRIPRFAEGLRDGNFSVRGTAAGMEIENKTLGIIGLGRIGSEIARKAAQGFGMNIAAYDPFCSPGRVPEGIRFCHELEQLLGVADFVSLHLPVSVETKKMFGAPQFAAMKPGAYFINCARGEIVDEAALAEALRQGWIGGAAVDVYDPEPPSADHPLLGLPNVIATPHVASNTMEANAKMALHAAMEIHRVLSGENPQWPLNAPVFPGRPG